MTQLLSTTYLLILLSFLSLLSYYISSEILKNIQEDNIFNLPETLSGVNEAKLDHLLHLNLIKVYSKRSITDAAIYEIEFLLQSATHQYSHIVISNLYSLLGENFESLSDYRSAMQAYSKATTISQDNKKAQNNLARLSNKYSDFN